MSQAVMQAKQVVISHKWCKTTDS